MEAIGFERRILERYSTKEKDILLNLIRSKAAILENKASAYHVVISKKIAWQEIADEFNSYDEFKDPHGRALGGHRHHGGTLLGFDRHVSLSIRQSGLPIFTLWRTPAQLKKWWENEKARRKKLRAAYSLRASANGVDEPLPSGEPIPQEVEFVVVPSLNYCVLDSVNRDQDKVVPPNVVEENHAPLPPSDDEVDPALSGGLNPHPPSAGYGLVSDYIHPMVVSEAVQLPYSLNIKIEVNSPSVPEVSLTWDSLNAPQTTAMTAPFTTNGPPTDKVSHGIAVEESKQRLKRIAAVPSQDGVLYRLRYREQRCILQAARLKCASLIADKEHRERLNRKEMEAAEEAILHKRQLHDQLMLQKSELHEQLMLQQMKEHVLRMKLMRIKGLTS
uniref:Regulatory protein zeste n=1 Tax=Timema shepardi TaxID=629360 RepID=A0A7R9ARH8_TIMSH|nr:unnamed protein product [Timema shepardi]